MEQEQKKEKDWIEIKSSQCVLDFISQYRRWKESKYTKWETIDEK